MRDSDGDGQPESNTIFAEHLNKPFGIAFYPLGDKPQYVYIGSTDSVIRYSYTLGNTKSAEKPDTIVVGLQSMLTTVLKSLVPARAFETGVKRSLQQTQSSHA